MRRKERGRGRREKRRRRYTTLEGRREAEPGSQEEPRVPRHRRGARRCNSREAPEPGEVRSLESVDTLALLCGRRLPGRGTTAGLEVSRTRQRNRCGRCPSRYPKLMRSLDTSPKFREPRCFSNRPLPCPSPEARFRYQPCSPPWRAKGTVADFEGYVYKCSKYGLFMEVARAGSSPPPGEVTTATLRGSGEELGRRTIY